MSNVVHLPVNPDALVRHSLHWFYQEYRKTARKLYLRDMARELSALEKKIFIRPKTYAAKREEIIQRYQSLMEE